MEDFLKTIQDFSAQYGFQIIGAIITLIIGLWLAKFISKLVAKTLIKKEVDQTLTKFFASLVKSVLIIFVLISVASQLGIETTSFIAIIGAAGLAIGFALQGSLSNFAAGIMLIIFRPFKAGDFIEGGGIMGSVEQVGIFITILNTPDNKKIFVPNSKLTSDNIINFSANDTRRVDMVFGIGYSDDIDEAKSTIKSVLENDNRILNEPAPQIVVSELADSSVNFNVRPWVNSSDYWGVYFDITEKIKKKFDEQKISIPFPQRDVHIHQN
jgi:small conductance mechanosensitive channel